ncbi:MAG: exosortase-associated EpsI family protein [Opitutus sp.]|nr:exosortase-associated EpsI family protein [Opitutus sp.]
MTSRTTHATAICWPAVVCAFVGAAVFQFFGNANHGYIDTSSLFYWWGFQWINPSSDSEHGWLILGLSGWLFWKNLRKAESAGLRAERQTSADRTLSSELSPLSSPWPAGAAMASGLALHALGFAAQQTRLSIVAFLLCTWGVLRLAGGRRWGAAAAFPLAFMLFAVPINVLDSIGFWLRVWVVNASALIAHGAGIGVLRSGTQLVAPDGAYNYDVAAACSGIRSLTAVSALSLLSGYLNFQTGRRRGVVLLLCFPLVYLGNVARIVAIVFAAQLGGPKWGDVAHEVMGYGVFAIVLGGVLAGVGAIRRWWPEPAPDLECHVLRDTLSGVTSERIEKCHVIRDTGAGWRGARAVAAGVVALAIGEMFFLRHLANLPARGAAGVMLAADGKNPVELPAFLGTEWIGRRAEVSAVEREILPADTGFSRKSYVPLADPKAHVFLSIVLSGRDRTSIHRPELCLVGQGWTVVDTVRHAFRFPARPEAGFEATLLRVRREVQTPRGRTVVPQLVAYWFVGGDGAVKSSHWQMFFRDAWNRVAHARADRWAYVLMQTDASDGEAAALARMQTVLDGTLPVFAPRKP